MALATSVKQSAQGKLVTLIVEKYGFTPRKIYPSQKGYRNISYPVALTDGRMVNVMLYKTEPGIAERIKNANEVSDFLAERGFPTRQTIGKIMQLQAGALTKYSAVYTYLPGKTIPWEAYTKDHIKLLGLTMSNMHAALHGAFITEPKTTSVMPDLIRHPVNNRLDSGSAAGMTRVLRIRCNNAAVECLALNKRMQRYFNDVNVQAALERKLGLQIDEKVLQTFTEILAACDQLPNQQMLHMDFVRGNVLFDDMPSGDLKFSVTGILDFEKTASGHPVFDIARTLAFLLVDCKLKTEAKVRKYFLHSGYQKRGAHPLTAVVIKTPRQQVDVLEALTTFFLFHDFYKFLHHNPYEFLEQNEHFTRTRDILLQRHVISEMDPTAPVIPDLTQESRKKNTGCRIRSGMTKEAHA